MKREQKGGKKKRYNVEQIIEKCKEDADRAFTYVPNQETNILTAESANKMVFILLRNGTLLSFGESGEFLGKNKEYKGNHIVIIGTPVKIVNISCGKEHILAKGINHKIYSWGSNSQGQVYIY
jgi:alpha-tubulin suppressor-like RCC1 family protein